MRQPYTSVAPLYDVLSGEWPVYRVGRRLGVRLLGLGRGDTVVDIGCGTGLNFPMLRESVGVSGVVVGLDTSASMLATARRKIRSGTGGQVRLWQRDATDLTGLARAEPALATGADAVLFTYSLSLMRPWQRAWDQSVALARPGARVVVVDMARPRGRGRALSPLARLACRLGGADIDAHPWTALRRQCIDVTQRTAWAGHIQVWAGTVPADGLRPLSGTGSEPTRGPVATDEFGKQETA